MENKEKEFFDFVYNRQLIWYKRFVLKENPPWTNDKTLQRFKILNVYRELDKGTIYLIKKLKDLGDSKIILLNVVFYRFFNRFNLYEKLGIGILEDFSDKKKNELIKSLNKLRKLEPLFNDAYLIAGKKNEEKYLSVLDSLTFLWENIEKIIVGISNAKEAKESFGIIKELPLVGSFLAYEIWTDLTYFGFFKQGWTDNDFVNIGPGAKEGLNIIYGRSNLSNLKKLHEIQEKFLSEKRNPTWNQIHYEDAFSNEPLLSLRNIEHSLCEFRKYYNLGKGKGKKRIFRPNAP